MNKIFIIVVLLFLFSLNSAFALDYDYSSTESIPVKLSILETVSTKNPPVEGSTLIFKIREDVRHNGEILFYKDDIIEAKLETVITSGMNGFPAELIVDNFRLPNIKQSQIQSKYIKSGQNRCLWVYPLKWALTFFPPSGSLTNFIMGGHAKIKPKDVITVYYYPYWK